MNRQFKEFKESVKHMSREDLVRQLYLSANTKGSPQPGDKVDAINETQFPFLKNVLLYSLEKFRFGVYAKLRRGDETYTIPYERVVLTRVEEGADKHE
ncbi:hypothetical protein [Paenibacillus amylolyticus]|nr:hypothetical protein [Paenibacillus amylolyticus]OMF47734.1 hypothetical protein BK136_02245 [Paenibacillus amylolyticus]